jgi:hypothetical protein
VSFIVDSEVVRLAEAIDAQAMADFLLAAPASWRRDHPVVVDHIGDVVVALVPNVPAIELNRIVGIGIATPATRGTVDTILERVRAAGAGTDPVQLAPAALPAELPRWLEERGLHAGHGWVKMVRDASPPPEIATDLRVERIEAAQATSFARVACAAYGMPQFLGPLLAASVGRDGWSHYLAYDGRLPVACAALFTRDHLGWLGTDATLASHRRRGGQGALQARRIRDAADQGCRLLVTETGDPLPGEPSPSFDNMRRLGFELAYVRANYVPV